MVRQTLGKLLAVLMLLALYQCLEDVEILGSVWPTCPYYRTGPVPRRPVGPRRGQPGGLTDHLRLGRGQRGRRWYPGLNRQRAGAGDLYLRQCR